VPWDIIGSMILCSALCGFCIGWILGSAEGYRRGWLIGRQRGRLAAHVIQIHEVVGR
jgi:hypothetical protein